MYSATTSLADPPAESPIADGVAWVQGVVFGSTATTVAVLAVAGIGLLMLSGRLELRRGVTVTMGCFILFGASGIAAVLTGLTGSERRSSPAIVIDTVPLRRPLPAPVPEASVYDPYAGASVPGAR